MYRDAFMVCPGCGRGRMEHAGSVQRCSDCAGMWIEEGVLTEMMRTMDGVGSLEKLAFVTDASSYGAPPPRGCPACRKPLARVILHAVVLDRCASHGIYFDRDELEQALHRRGDPAADAGRGSGLDASDAVDIGGGVLGVLWALIGS